MNRLIQALGGAGTALLLAALGHALLGAQPPYPGGSHGGAPPLPVEQVAAESVGGVASDTVPQFVGTQRCQSCHRPSVAGFATTPKGEQILEHPRTALERSGCEGCHGPGSQHVAVEGKERTRGFLYFDREDPAPVEVRNSVCLQCHEGSGRMFWLGSAHESRDVACTDCHQVMAAISERGQLGRPTVAGTCATCHLEQVRRQEMSLARMPGAEGKMDCANCHNAHGTPNDKLLVASSVNESCTSCHMEKRGPFLWEHAPVVENCASCHDPHGSRNASMLAVPMPRLCQECHIRSGHPSDPQSPAARFVIGKQCANCHVAVHGSNHPSGTRFVR